MQRERFQMSKEKAAATEAEKEIEQLIKGDTTSFIPQGVVMTKRAADAEKFGDKTKLPTPTEIEQAKAYDSNRVESEIASAKGMDLATYLANGPQDPRAKAARTKVWNFANGNSSAPSGAVSRIPGI
jgi:hypothetical protein